jgi:hypothetical protein
VPATATPATTHVPTPKDVKEQLSGLLGREVSLSPTTPMSPGSTSSKTVAVYVDDRLTVRAVIACDLPFSAYAGAAIGLVPPTGAEAAIEAGTLDETLSENLYEVLNVMAAAFNAEGAVHVKLLDVHPAGGRIPAAVHIRLVPLGRREDFTVDIAGYGTGRFSVVVCS